MLTLRVICTVSIHFHNTFEYLCCKDNTEWHVNLFTKFYSFRFCPWVGNFQVFTLIVISTRKSVIARSILIPLLFMGDEVNYLHCSLRPNHTKRKISLMFVIFFDIFRFASVSLVVYRPVDSWHLLSIALFFINNFRDRKSDSENKWNYCGQTWK